MKKITYLLGIVLLICTGVFEYQQKKLKDDEIVIAFGDSLTYGYGDKEGEGYIDGLEHELNHQQDQKKIHIWNYGIVGLESEGVLKQLDKEMIRTKLDKADHFIVFIGTNDFINSNGGNLKEIHGEQIKQEKKEYVQNLKKITSILLNENDKASILVLGLYNPYKENDEIEKYIEDYDASIKKIAGQNERIFYIETNDLFKNKEKQDYFSDSLHLNEKGVFDNLILSHF
ncbi:SGNH/GDSL hydrolase family protein [Bacillus massiliglaciei]|uniref:SGNH/GDSL hydrolase family protein n=1 Tax=Bacillus massiliglaciei TaxID=1816693 RepID=UPI000DA634C2|nr:SGNH/GDSL hydrolase family protein [Bacillus massiliglaciei]